MRRKTVIGMVAASTMVGIIVSGCQSASIKTQPVSKELAAHPEIAQTIGYKRTTKDIDGTVRTSEVVAVKNDLFEYKTTDGYEWTNYSNPMLPGPTFSGADWGTGTQKMSAVKGSMFPLKIGNKMSFTVTGKSDKWPDGWIEKRKCKVESQERVTVVAGEYDAFKVVCDSERRKRVYFFSPEINDIVWHRNTHKTDPSRTTGWELFETPGAGS